MGHRGARSRRGAQDPRPPARPLVPDGRPLFVTVTPTVGAHSHLDCTLWCVLNLDPDQAVHPDSGEFSDWAWFPRTEVAGWPVERTDPQMTRMLRKLDLLHTRRPDDSGEHASR